MTPKLHKYFSNNAARSLRYHIDEADGNEVFLVGYLNNERRVESVEVFARGNETSAPALMQVARQGNVVIHNHPSGPLKPSTADMHVASVLGNDGIGFYIVNNAVSDIFVVVEAFTEKKVEPVNAGELNELFVEGGSLAHKLDNFEFRPQQLKMVVAISDAINENKIAIVEAGTGTGKTLAYLLPAITHAIKNKERVVVSTNTINLQEQLIHKDLPLLKSVLKEDFKAVLVKGRSNYACKRKLAEAGQEIDLFSEEEGRAELQTVLKWAKTTKDGSKSDMNIEPSPQVWEKIQSESDTSLKLKCPFYKECFFYTARRKAATVDILVANHHLLFSDLAVRATLGASENAVLPTYDRIILDEAHNIEDVATNYFGVSITYLGILRLLNRIYRMKGDNEKGLLGYIAHMLQKHSRGFQTELVGDALFFAQNDGKVGIEKLKMELTATMERLFFTLQEQNKYGEAKLRLTSDVRRSPYWQDIPDRVKHLIQTLRKVTSELNKFIRTVDKIQGQFRGKTASLTIDLRAQSDRLDAAAKTIEHVLLDDDDANIRWVEVREGYRKSKIVRLRSAPLEVASILKTHVFEKFGNVLMTSATLSVENRFDYLKKRLGLNLIQPDRMIELALPAPFDYKRQTFVGIPLDVPDPKDRSFADCLPECILNSLKISRGRAFVLFTSYSLLNLIYNRMRSDIENLGYNVYKQGQENRHRLLERFRSDVSSVLFGTDSFWEGVDVQGESLQCIIIVKLPFRVPSEPVVQARIEAIERSGRNAFLEYSVPQAVIKFRQGFGRLIRSKSDRGAVLILDKRVIQKRYGRVFLNSLPQCTFEAASKNDVFEKMASFFKMNNRNDVV
ncbi:MAG: helicase C-terminal domain-containing protein [bacterium]